MFEASAILVGDGIDGTPAETSGVDITVWSDNEDFSAMGYVVDQLDSLIDEWFPGARGWDGEEAYGWDGGGGTKLSLEGACVLYLGVGLDLNWGQ